MQSLEPLIDNRRFGMYLRGIREDRKLSLAAVEKMSSDLPQRVTKSHLSRLENGQAAPSFARIYTLSVIYGIPVASLADRFGSCVYRQQAIVS